jgi:hypothetical protein
MSNPDKSVTAQWSDVAVVGGQQNGGDQGQSELSK